MDHNTRLHMDLSHFPDELGYIHNFCSRLRLIERKGDLGNAIAREISHYTVYDLQVIGGKFTYEIEKLPSPYRELVRPYFQAQLFGMHHTLLAMQKEGKFATMQEPVRNRREFLEFCDMVVEGCFRRDPGDEIHFPLYRPRHRFFYYLVSGFTMFVLEQPGHPVGTPFPGGFRVEEKNGDFLCPIRDHEKEITYSLCNVCPARQAEMNR